MFDRELLAIFRSLKHFQYYVEGRNFTIFTDHKPLVRVMTKASPLPLARQQRHQACISAFTSDLWHMSGKDNMVVDCLSQPSCAAASVQAPKLTLDTVACEQEADAELPLYKTSTTGLQVERHTLNGPGDPIQLWCDSSQSMPRPNIPAALRRTVFETYHALTHPSGQATAKLVARAYVWHGMYKDILQWGRECLNCQQAKIHRHIRVLPQAFVEPSSHFEHIHLDLIGPLLQSQGFWYIFTITDCLTQWPEAIPVQEASAASCTTALSAWISRFGVPALITSDWGASFTSQLWACMSDTLGIALKTTTAYHPQANGVLEMFHCTLKMALKAHLANANWSAELPWVLLGLHTTPKAALGYSLAQLVYGRHLHVPGRVVPSSSGDNAMPTFKQLLKLNATLTPVPTVHRPVASLQVPPSIQEAKYVFVRRDNQWKPLDQPYEGPFRVVHKKPKDFLY